MEWQLAEAKNRFSELVTRALTAGPQRVRRRKDVVVVMSAAEYERLTGGRPSFKQFLCTGEDLDGVDLARDRSEGREIAL